MEILNPNTEKACQILSETPYTCVLCKDTAVFTSTQRGVKPLVDWLQDDHSYVGFSAADKVVGKATAFLYCLLQIESVSAWIMSKPALDILQAHGIHAHYDLLVDHIINRTGDGVCPFESAVMDICEPDLAFQVILETMRQMGIPHK